MSLLLRARNTVAAVAFVGGVVTVPGTGTATAFLNVHGDPPVDIAGGSIHGRTGFWHAWHQREEHQAYRVPRTSNNDLIVITDTEKKALAAYVSPQWRITFSTRDGNGSIRPDVFQLCRNETCDLNSPVDADGQLYLQPIASTRATAGHNGQWGHTLFGLNWRELEYKDTGSNCGPTRGDDHPCDHISEVCVITKPTPSPEPYHDANDYCWNGVKTRLPDDRGHVLIGSEL